MKTFKFVKRKYGFELLMDLHKFEGNDQVYFDPNAHTIDFFEVMLFECVSGDVSISDHHMPIHDYCALFACPNQIKSYRIPVNGTMGYHLVFQQDFLSDFFEDKLFVYRLQYFFNSEYPQYVSIPRTQYKTLANALDEIIHEIHHYQNDSKHILRSLLYFTLAKLNRVYAHQYAISSDTQSHPIIYRFKNLLESQIRSIHSVEEYAHQLSINRHRFNELCKIHFGKTAKQLITIRLIQEIKTLLLYTNKNIAELADQLNFSEPNNLTRFFSSNTGMSPTTYRQLSQNDR